MATLYGFMAAYGTPMPARSYRKPDASSSRPESSHATQSASASSESPAGHSRSSSGSAGQTDPSSRPAAPLPPSAAATTTAGSDGPSSAAPATETSSSHRAVAGHPGTQGNLPRSSVHSSQRTKGRRAAARNMFSPTPAHGIGIAGYDARFLAMSHGPDAMRQAAAAAAANNKQASTSTVREDSVSSNSANASGSTRTLTTSDLAASRENFVLKPFIQRNGRTYLNDATLPYPFPVDLTELHRQSLRTLMLIQVFGAPVCSPSLLAKPPQRVLEIGCGSGFWSMMCHRYFKSKGHYNISFTGIDIAPLAPGSANTPGDETKPDPQMKWKFIQHDLRQRPWPLPDEEFDLVMVKDMSAATPTAQNQDFIDEYLRLVTPGGTVEFWESDHIIRMLRPHVPGSVPSHDDGDEQEAASRLGAYIMTANTPLSAPLNTFLVEYNHWVSKAFESRNLPAVCCPHIGPSLLQEAELLTNTGSRRLAIPLSEVRWEREGVGGVVTKDGKSYVEMKGRGPHHKVEKKSLTKGQAALRKTALLTVVQQVQTLEPLLREVSGKSQDEWNTWWGKMMGDLMSESGTSWGECLEIGAWWATKKKSSQT